MGNHGPWKGEIILGGFTDEAFKQLDYRTKRRVGIGPAPTDNPNIFTVFVQRWEHKKKLSERKRTAAA